MKAKLETKFVEDIKKVREVDEETTKISAILKN